jgi:hypothetical protein
MAKENTVKVPVEEEFPEAAEVRSEGKSTASSDDRRGLSSANVSRYVRYAIFLVIIGLAYIWNSHVAEKQVRRENKLKQQVADAKAEYKTMHARLSAGTRQSAIQDRVDTLGLHPSSKNIYQLKRD